MAESYKVPTNFELVGKAKVIVLARVESVPATLDGEKPADPAAFVTLKPLRFLKGSAAPGSLRLMGASVPGKSAGVPAATTLWQSHFSAGMGACIRLFYQPGELVVAMFNDDPEVRKITGTELTQLTDAWARAVETVDGPDDVWVRAVDAYVALQAGDPASMKDRAAAEVRRLRALATPEAQGVAADLDYHLQRGDRDGTWGSFAMPTFTSAGVAGQKGAQLYCIAGTPPGVLIEAHRSTEPPRIIVDGSPHLTDKAAPTAAEQRMLKPSANPLLSAPPTTGSLSIYRFSASTLGALRRATKHVSLEAGGRALIGGPPLDALLRWASHCEKLQALPAPQEQNLRD